jgi:DegV family protein with EDD domain
MEDHPNVKIESVDTLGATGGVGLLLMQAIKGRDEGKTVEENAAYLRKIAPDIGFWFMVEDLEYLKRGGRISGATAVVGSVLSIKPVMHVDNEGHLIKVRTVRGRKASIKALADEAGRLGIDLSEQTIFISHGDCLEDANFLADIMRSRYGVKKVVINYVGPVIGAHSGPGTIALFFLGTER